MNTENTKKATLEELKERRDALNLEIAKKSSDIVPNLSSENIESLRVLLGVCRLFGVIAGERAGLEYTQIGNDREDDRGWDIYYGLEHTNQDVAKLAATTESLILTYECMKKGESK